MGGDLTDYLQLRGEKLGYGASTIFYIIRRCFATDMTQELGPDTGRLLMGHDEASRVLEEYYMDFSPERRYLLLRSPQRTRGGRN